MPFVPPDECIRLDPWGNKNDHMIDRCGIKDGINIDAAKHCKLVFLVLGIVTSLWQVW
jgi:hypothetical protein